MREKQWFEIPVAEAYDLAFEGDVNLYMRFLVPSRFKGDIWVDYIMFGRDGDGYGISYINPERFVLDELTLQHTFRGNEICRVAIRTE